MMESVTNAIVRSDWMLLGIVGLILLIATELGYRLGIRLPAERREPYRDQSTVLQGALLGLFGLLLGFSFAMSVDRYDARRSLVVEEANSIGTTWLRAGFLSDRNRDIIRPALVEYIGVRLAAVEYKPGSDQYHKQGIRSQELQDTMWRAIVAEIKVRDTESTTLFAESLNNLIDLDALRRAAVRNHVPFSVWILLVLVAFIVSIITGYTTALSGSGRYVFSMIMLPLLFCVVIMIIADLDNPQNGVIKVSQQSLIDLQKTLSKY